MRVLESGHRRRPQGRRDVEQQPVQPGKPRPENDAQEVTDHIVQ